MNTQEAAALLAVAAAFDNRKPDADAATAWSLALDGLRFMDCRDAIVAHYRASSDWLMPSKVIAEVKRIRTKRLLEFGPLEPPTSLDADDVDAYAEWIYTTQTAIADGDLMPTPQPVQIASPMPPELAQKVARFGHLPSDVANVKADPA